MKKTVRFLTGALALAALSTAAHAQVYVAEDSNYSSFEELNANWSNATGLSLDTGNGNVAPSAAHSGAGTVHNWIGGSFSIIPTDANPLILTGDLYYTGVSPQRNTIGLRTGANPLFEMGFYNDAVLGATGLSVRVLSFAGANNWVELVDYADLGTEPQWISMSATFTSDALAVTYDLGADGSIDGTFTSSGETTEPGFSDLRFGGPSALTSASGFNVDNITLTVVPEPSTYAMVFGGLTLAGAVVRRRFFNKA